MQQFFKELFHYNHRMNQKLIHEFTQHPGGMSERSVKWLNHILNAHQVWNNRIDPQEEVYGVWQVHSLGYLKDIDLSNHNRTLEIFKSYDLASEVKYVNTAGKAFTNSVKDILFHVANHSTYHRGQIASDMKESGLVPLITDYIAFKR